MNIALQAPRANPDPNPKSPTLIWALFFRGAQSSSPGIDNAEQMMQFVYVICAIDR